MAGTDTWKNQTYYIAPGSYCRVNVDASAFPGRFLLANTTQVSILMNGYIIDGKHTINVQQGKNMDIVFYNTNDNTTSSQASVGVGYKSAVYLKVGAAFALAVSAIIG